MSTKGTPIPSVTKKNNIKNNNNNNKLKKKNRNKRNNNNNNNRNNRRQPKQMIYQPKGRPQKKNQYYKGIQNTTQNYVIDPEDIKKDNNRKDNTIQKLSMKTNFTGVTMIGSNILTMPVKFEVTNITIALATYLSRLVMGNVLGSACDNTQTNVWPEFLSGLSYLGEALYSIPTSGTIKIGAVPRIFEVMLGLCAPKKVKLGTNLVAYTPEWTSSFGLSTSFNTPTESVYAFIPPNSSLAINVASVPIPPNENDYQVFLKNSVMERVWGTQTVDYPPAKTKFYWADPSAYARSYVYFGTGGTTSSGLYSESELEVPFFYPMFSKFVTYDTDDTVISRIFHPQSGGISTPIGLSLTSAEYDYRLLKNPYPVIYKYLDFYQLYSTVIGWLIAIFDQTPANIVGNNSFTKPVPFQFSYTDFILVLRQCILSVFPEQCHGQFLAPVSAVPSSSNSVFQPFIVDPICAPLSTFASFNLPQFLVENLCMLKSIYIQVGHTNDNTPNKLRINYVPVWGIYSGDQPPIPSYTDPETGNSVPIFAGTSRIPSCRIYDFISNTQSNTKINVNMYVNSIISEWNTFCAGFAQNKSSMISPLNVDTNKRISLLPYTRVVKKYDQNLQDNNAIKPSFLVPRMDEFIVNSPSSDSLNRKKKVNLISPATQYELYTDSILSNTQLSTEVAGAFRYFLIPTIRFEYTTGDKLTFPAYSIYTSEIASLASSNSDSTTAIPEIYRYVINGTTLSSGMFPGDPNNNVLTKASDIIFKTNSGADFLSMLTGGVSSILPMLGNVVGSLFG